VGMDGSFWSAPAPSAATQSLADAGVRGITRQV
jgi:hypothetical protein